MAATAATVPTPLLNATYIKKRHVSDEHLDRRFECRQDLGGSLIRQSSGTTESTRILEALPFRSQTKELVVKENVRAVISYNEAYELSYFTNSKKVIDLHKKRKESVYVHCKAGMGRSAVATVCYLIRANSMDPEKAIEFARSKRPHISIYERQRQRILEFHESLKAEKQD
ncbi:hypothetical protein EMCRGX_G016806 [Ephydatia muelleri]